MEIFTITITWAEYCWILLVSKLSIHGFHFGGVEGYYIFYDGFANYTFRQRIKSGAHIFHILYYFILLFYKYAVFILILYRRNNLCETETEWFLGLAYFLGRKRTIWVWKLHIWAKFQVRNTLKIPPKW